MLSSTPHADNPMGRVINVRDLYTIVTAQHMLMPPLSVVCQLFHLFTATVIQWGGAIKGVAVLQAAIERYRLSPSHLTSIHSDLVQVGCGLVR